MIELPEYRILGPGFTLEIKAMFTTRTYFRFYTVK